MKNQDVISGFRNVYRSAEVQFFIKFADAGNWIPSVLECTRKMEEACIFSRDIVFLMLNAKQVMPAGNWRNVQQMLRLRGLIPAK